MAISIEEVSRIAKLAKLSFSEAEKQKLQHELSAILDYVKLLELVQSKITPKLADDPDSVNLMRNDVTEEFTPPEEFLAQAPSREGNFIKVKSVLE